MSRYVGAVIERGKILCYRVFDAGDVIALDVAEKTLAAKRVEIVGPLAEGLFMPVRPLEVAVGSCTIHMPRLGRDLEATCTARVFDFGAISFLYEIDIEPGTTLEQLTPLCDALYDAPELDARGKVDRKKLVDRLGDSIEKPHEWAEGETYTIVFVEKLSGTRMTEDGHRASIAELSRSEAVAKLLLGETSDKPLSDATRDDVLKNAFSYLVDDLVVVDWNSALVVEPSGSRIVPFVLELATSQLLEFRYYDGILDRELARVYDHVEKSRPRILRSPFGKLMRRGAPLHGAHGGHGARRQLDQVGRRLLPLARLPLGHPPLPRAGVARERRGQARAHLAGVRAPEGRGRGLSRSAARDHRRRSDLRGAPHRATRSSVKR